MRSVLIATERTVLILTVIALAALSLAAPATASSPRGQRSSQGVPNVQGTWAMKLVEVSQSKAPVVGDVQSTTTTYLKVDMTQKSRRLRMTEKACAVDITSDQGAVSTHIPDAFVAHMSPVERTATLQRVNGAWTLHSPKTYQYYGLRPEIGSAPLPRDANNKYVFDQDEDGHPGMTVRLKGVLSGEIYMIQRTWDQLDAKLYRSGRWVGPVTWKTDQIVLGKSGRIFGDMSASQAVLDKSFFKLAHIQDGATCEDIVQQKDKLF